MRKLSLVTLALALSACSSSGSSGSSGGSTGGFVLKDGVVLDLDKTRMLFGQDYGNATLLGTQPLDTVQLLSDGKQTLTLSSVQIVSGTDTDGGALADTGVFSTQGASQSSVEGGQTAFVQVVFAPPHEGRFGAILRITSNASPSTTDVVLSGDCVNPAASLYPLGSSTDVQLPQWTLVGKDGGGYATGYSSTNVQFVDTGTAQLHLQPAVFSDDAGTDSPFELCAPKEGTNGCDPGPAPNSLERTYPDGGLAIEPFADGGARGVGVLQVGFKPTAPGTYSQHVYVTTDEVTGIDATGTPSFRTVDLTLHATAVAP